ncbi:uncharacterized protein [Apostichopus japonicus]|uniref:uncharacterized protein n=1 Tax=Stichopus japonicus TaxID=307972 RepID=UPI003AB24E71
MPVAMKTWNGSIEYHPTPLKDVNMGPDFVHARNILHSNIERVRRKPVMESRYGDILGSKDDPRKMRNRGRHKEKDTTESELPREMNKTGDGHQRINKRKEEAEGSRSGTDSEGVKLSVRDRVQLLNGQSGSERESKSRGRSVVTRGWMKNRDQSAPPASNRNRVFHDQNSVPENVSPSRRSRSIERSRDKALDQSHHVEFVSSRGQRHLDLKQPPKLTLSTNSAFTEVGKPSSLDPEEERRSVDTEKNKKTVLSASMNTPAREPHFNPRSRMRDARTVKSISKSINVKRKSPSGSHLQNVVNSLHETENRTVVNTSDGSAGRVAVGNNQQSSGVSVKRMVSFIHKGGLTDVSITRPQIPKRDRKEVTDSESLSRYSSSQARQTPDHQLSSSIVSSIDLESLKTESQLHISRLVSSDSKPLKLDKDLMSTSFLGIELSKDTQQLLFEPQKTSLTPDNDDGLSQSNKNETQVDSTVLFSQNNRKDSGKVESSYLKSEQKETLNSKPTDVTSFSQGQQRVYNLHYKSDSSSSRCKSDDNNRLKTKEKDDNNRLRTVEKDDNNGLKTMERDVNNRLKTTEGTDPEWEEIVARSYEVDTETEPPQRVATYRDGDTTDGRALVMHYPPKLPKPASKSASKENNIDVFNKSMHPLDFALAIRDITEPNNTVRSSDQSFDAADSPRDGVVFARRVQIRDETDSQPAAQSVNCEKEENVDIQPDDASVPRPQIWNDTRKDRNENTIRGRDAAGMKSRRRKETYSALTTVSLKSDGSGGMAEDVTSSLNVSVEVDIDSEEADYVKINPSYKPLLDQKEQKSYSSIPNSYKAPKSDPPGDGIVAHRDFDERKGYHDEQKLYSSIPSSYKAPTSDPPGDGIVAHRDLDERKGYQKEQKSYSGKPEFQKLILDIPDVEMSAQKGLEEKKCYQTEQTPHPSTPNSSNAQQTPRPSTPNSNKAQVTVHPEMEMPAPRRLDERKDYQEQEKPYSSRPNSYKPLPDLPDAETIARRGFDEVKEYPKEHTPHSNTRSNRSKLKAKSQVDVQPTSLEVVKPKLSASPEVRRHRLKMGHYRMPSKSSVASTGSVSYHQSSQGSSTNDAGGQRKSQSRKSSVFSPTLSGKRSNPPPNDITVTDPHSSMEGSITLKPRSKAKYSRSNSEVSSSSTSSQSQLNRFFDMMGLELEVLSSVLQPFTYDDDTVFQDMHTWRVGSSNNSSHSGSLSEGSKVSADGVMNMKKLTKLPDQSQSIITKNARVIKWLVHCKKSLGAAR